MIDRNLLRVNSSTCIIIMIHVHIQDHKKKYEPPPPPPRVGKKQRRRPGASALGTKLPTVVPTAKCKLRQLKLERIKDWLLMEEEFVANQERLKPQEERNEEDRSKVDDLRGSPLSVGTLEELIDEKCVTDYYVIAFISCPCF